MTTASKSAMLGLLFQLKVPRAELLPKPSCVPASDQLKVSWERVADAELYDLQIGPAGNQDPFSGFHVHSNQTEVVVSDLIPGREYWFQLIAHSRSSQVRSGRQECTAPAALTRRQGASPSRSSSRRRGYFISEMIRHNHDANIHDGLDNRNAADARGQAWFFSRFDFNNCHMSLYHVHVKKTAIPQQVTPKGPHSEYYANYMSCNPSSRPTAVGGYECFAIGCGGPTSCGGGDCDILGMGKGCTTRGCMDTSRAKDHVGMARIGAQANGGRWYSLPYAGFMNSKSLDEKHWWREKKYLTATCHKGMTEDQVTHAFHRAASFFATPWESDDSAFELGLLNASAATVSLTVV